MHKQNPWILLTMASLYACTHPRELDSPHPVIDRMASSKEIVGVGLVEEDSDPWLSLSFKCLDKGLADKTRSVLVVGALGSSTGVISGREIHGLDRSRTLVTEILRTGAGLGSSHVPIFLYWLRRLVVGCIFCNGVWSR